MIPIPALKLKEVKHGRLSIGLICSHLPSLERFRGSPESTNDTFINPYTTQILAYILRINSFVCLLIIACIIFSFIKRRRRLYS